jgi:Skp family chaperone for outer membrane proteins
MSIRVHMGLVLAAIAAPAVIWGVASADRAAAQPAQAQQVSPRIATIDMYSIVEKVTQRPEYKKAQDEFKATWEPKIEAVRAEFRKIESDLQVLPQGDPKFQNALRAGQEKQAEFEKLLQDQNIEYEAMSSKHVVEAYALVREAASKLAERQGYTHLFVTRPPERPIPAETLGNTLQELLARPILMSPAGDDLTKAVASELNVPLDAPAATPPPKPAG